MSKRKGLEHTGGSGRLRCKIPVLMSICIGERPGRDTQEAAS